MSATNTLPQDIVQELFNYVDGNLYWRETRTNVVAGSLAGSPNGGKGHFSVQIENELYRLHNLIWIYFNGDIPEGMVIDHRDNNGGNNAIGNLRLATNSQNSFNSKKRKETSSTYKGVHWNKQSKSWRASIRVDGKVKCIGNYSTEHAAHLAWCDVAKELHGEFFRAA